MSVTRTPGRRVLGPSQSAPPGPTNPEPRRPRDGIGLRELLTVLWRRGFLVLAVMLVCTGATAYVVLRQPKVYSATAVVRMVDLRQSAARGLEDANVDRSQRVDPLLSQIELLKSRAVVAKTIEAEGLRLRPAPGEPFSARLTQVRIAPAAISDTFFLTFSPKDLTILHGSRETRVAYGVSYKTPAVSFTVPAHPGVDRTTLVLSPLEETVDWMLRQLRVSPRK